LNDNVEGLAIKVSSQAELDRASDFFTSKGYKWFIDFYTYKQYGDKNTNLVLTYKNKIYITYDVSWVAEHYKIINKVPKVQMEFDFEEHINE
jgi:hypothetical protein